MLHKILFAVSLLSIFSYALTAQSSDSIKQITIIGVGDIMIGSDFPDKRSLPPRDDSFGVLSAVADILQDATLTIGNLEGCFSNNAPLVKRCKDTTLCYAFRMPERYAPSLKKAGFDVLTIANNHSGDFGEIGRQTTVRLLDSLDIKHAGWIKYPTSIFERDGIRYGICSFSPNSGTMDINDSVSAKKIITEVSQLCDITIVTFHGGAEGSKYTHVPRTEEIFYGENRGNVYQFARLAIDAGADVVFGHGPHVPRSIDVYKNRFIAYSLGNFATYGKFNLSGVNGLAPIAKIKINHEGEFLEGEIISAKQIGEGITQPDPEKKVVRVMRDLLHTDFPECLIDIDDNGFINFKK